MSVACWLVTGHFGRYTYLLPLGLIHHLIVKLSNVRYTYPTQTIGFDSSSYCKGSLSNVKYSYPTHIKCILAYLAQIYNLDCRLSNIEFCKA